MKKNIITIIGVVMFVSLMTINLSVSSERRMSDNNLLTISVATDTNAECTPSGSAFVIGLCSASGSSCFVNAGAWNCNP
jgi:hypothetical protein